MRKFLQTPFFFLALAALFFLPFLGGVHLFDWDEINFAEIAREMVVMDNYLETYINFEVFTEKPPLFMWLQAASMKIFGVGDYAARLPNALFGVLVLPVLFLMGKKLQNARFGFYWAMAWFGSILPHLYFKSGIIDPVFNFFIFTGIYFIIRYVWKRNDVVSIKSSKSQWFYLILAGVCTGLAILTKGPVAYLIIGLTLFVYWILHRFKWYIAVPHFILYSLVALGTVLVWASLNYMQHGSQFIIEFTIRQWTMLTTPDAGHGGFLGYHFVVLLVGCFPASIFAIQALIKKDLGDKMHQRDFKRWMTILFWVVLILFSIVTTKIVHYSSMAYYPLTYLAAVSMQQLERGQWKLTKLMQFGLWFIGGLAVVLTTVLPFFGMNIQKFKSLFAQDPFAEENINAAVNWTGWESLVGLFLLGVLIISLIIQKRNLRLRFHVLFFGTGIWVFLTLVFFIGKVESISQRAAIEFWEDKQNKDCYVTTYGYKSYAHLYYARIQPPAQLPTTTMEMQDGQWVLHRAAPQELNSNTHWLLHGKIDKTVYISCKITSYKKLEEELADEQFLYAKNGFYFYKREPNKQPTFLVE